MKKIVSLIITIAICFTLGTAVFAGTDSPSATDPTTTTTTTVATPTSTPKPTSAPATSATQSSAAITTLASSETPGSVTVKVDGVVISADSYSVDSNGNVTFNPNTLTAGVHTIEITLADGTTKVVTITVTDPGAVVSTGEKISRTLIVGAVLVVAAAIVLVVRYTVASRKNRD